MYLEIMLCNLQKILKSSVFLVLYLEIMLCNLQKILKSSVFPIEKRDHTHCRSFLVRYI